MVTEFRTEVLFERSTILRKVGLQEVEESVVEARVRSGILDDKRSRQLERWPKGISGRSTREDRETTHDKGFSDFSAFGKTCFALGILEIDIQVGDPYFRCWGVDCDRHDVSIFWYKESGMWKIRN